MDRNMPILNPMLLSSLVSFMLSLVSGGHGCQYCRKASSSPMRVRCMRAFFCASS